MFISATARRDYGKPEKLKEEKGIIGIGSLPVPDKIGIIMPVNATADSIRKRGIPDIVFYPAILFIINEKNDAAMIEEEGEVMKAGSTRNKHLGRIKLVIDGEENREGFNEVHRRRIG
jgi:hypothetical protein